MTKQKGYNNHSLQYTVVVKRSRKMDFNIRRQCGLTTEAEAAQAHWHWSAKVSDGG